MARFVNVAAKIDRLLGTTEEASVLVNVESIDNVVGIAPNKSRIILRGGTSLVVSMSIERLRDLLDPPPSKAIDEE